jgi:hypothetical protein
MRNWKVVVDPTGKIVEFFRGYKAYKVVEFFRGYKAYKAF